MFGGTLKFAAVKVVPYDVLRVKEVNGDSKVLVRFHTGQHVWLDWDEYKFLMRLSPILAHQIIFDGEEKVLKELVKLGVVTIKDVKPHFYITFKITKGCNLGCTYCLSGDTRVLMADGSWKPIRDIKEGDEVVGWDQKTNRLVRTKVLKTFKRRDILYLVKTDKVSIKVTDNHAILGMGCWHALDPKKASREVGNARRLGVDTILRFVTFPTEFEETKDYMLGYLAGVFYGDGTYVDQIAKGTGRSRYLRLVVKDREIIDRVRRYMNVLGIYYTEGVFRATSEKSYKKGEYPRIYVARKRDIARIREIRSDNKEWLRGFVAGFFDAEGSVTIGKGGPQVEFRVGSVRLSNTSDELLDLFKRGLETFGFRYAEYSVTRKKGRPSKVVYLVADGETTVKVRFFTVFRPVVSRKVERLLATKYRRTIVTAIERLGEDWVYNLHTGTGTYIAEGLIVHNCYEWANPEKLSESARIELAERTVKVFTEVGDLFFVWHGGEPTLFWETVIEPIVSKYYAPEHMIFAMQSNGVRFADEKFADRVANFLKKYKMGIGISIDGFKEDNWMRHFPDGTPAWEYTVKGIRNLTSRGVQVGTIVVVNDRSVYHLVDIVEWLHDDLGVHGGRLNPLFPAGHPEVVKHTPDPEEYAEGLVKVAKRVIEYNLDGDQVKNEYTVTNIVEYLTSFFDAASSICVRNVCGAGTYFFSIQPNGDVWPCDHVQFSLGNILDGWTPSVPRPAQMYKFWEVQAKQFQIYFNPNSQCAKCPYRLYCDGGGCSAFRIDMYGYEFYKKPPVYCPRKLFEFFEKLMKNGDDIKLAALAPNHVYKYWYLGGGSV